MKMQTVTLVLLFALCIAGLAKADQAPFERLKTLDFDFKYKGNVITAVSAASSRPYILVEQRGGSYWLWDLEAENLRLITDKVLEEKGVTAARWGNKHLALFSGYGRFLRLIDPENPDQPEDIPAEIWSAPLRSFIWLEERELLIDGVRPYVVQEGVLTHIGEQFSHSQVQSGLVVVDEHRYVTSGYEDQSLRLYSLPDGELLNEWRLGRWYSSRKITSIAVVNGRLLVASAGGRIEERSLDDGEVLWSARPCREGAGFFYSSQQQVHNSDFWRVGAINVNDKIFYGCGDRFGTIHLSSEGWEVEPLHRTLDIDVEKWLANVEMIPGTDLAVLVIAQEEVREVYVVDYQQPVVLQQLENIQTPSPGPVTYVAATNQLVLVGESDELYLYDLKTAE